MAVANVMKAVSVRLRPRVHSFLNIDRKCRWVSGRWIVQVRKPKTMVVIILRTHHVSCFDFDVAIIVLLL